MHYVVYLWRHCCPDTKETFIWLSMFSNYLHFGLYQGIEISVGSNKYFIWGSSLSNVRPSPKSCQIEMFILKVFFLG